MRNSTTRREQALYAAKLRSIDPTDTHDVGSTRRN
jgi:hypothetical protein